MENFPKNLTTSERTLAKYCKTKGYDKPIYKVESRASAKIGNVLREKHYTVSVCVNTIQLAIADGMSKRIARMKCATWGMQKLYVLELDQLMTCYRHAISDHRNSLRFSSTLAISTSSFIQPQIAAAINQVIELAQIEEIPKETSPKPTLVEPIRSKSEASEVHVIDTLEELFENSFFKPQKEGEKEENEKNAQKVDLKVDEVIENAKESENNEECHSNSMNDIQSLISEAVDEIGSFDKIKSEKSKENNN